MSCAELTFLTRQYCNKDISCHSQSWKLWFPNLSWLQIQRQLPFILCYCYFALHFYLLLYSLQWSWLSKSETTLYHSCYCIVILYCTSISYCIFYNKFSNDYNWQIIRENFEAYLHKGRLLRCVAIKLNGILFQNYSDLEFKVNCWSDWKRLLKFIFIYLFLTFLVTVGKLLSSLSYKFSLDIIYVSHAI